MLETDGWALQTKSNQNKHVWQSLTWIRNIAGPIQLIYWACLKIANIGPTPPKLKQKNRLPYLANSQWQIIIISTRTELNFKQQIKLIIQFHAVTFESNALKVDI